MEERKLLLPELTYREQTTGAAWVKKKKKKKFCINSCPVLLSPQQNELSFLMDVEALLLAQSQSLSACWSFLLASNSWFKELLSIWIFKLHLNRTDHSILYFQSEQSMTSLPVIITSECFQQIQEK